MDRVYGFHDSTTSTSSTSRAGDDYADRGGLNLIISDPNIFPAIDYLHHHYTSASSMLQSDHRRFQSDDLGFHCESISPTTHQQNEPSATCNSIKARIASHPCYPKLIDAYIDCQKVGAPAEIAGLLEEIRREKNYLCNTKYQDLLVPMCLGTDPELDEFMETYYEILVKYKSDLSRPFDEATSFLTNIQTQLGNLCSSKDDGSLSSDDELSGGETEAQDAQTRSEDRELKDKLLRRYGSHISNLKLEFSKKKKKGKLPKESRQALLEWWNVHYKWPYPTEADKISLAESTGLDQKQINNWFINQRKRHWKPSENMQLAIMNNLSGHFFTED